jgi:hypothetical protein
MAVEQGDGEGVQITIRLPPEAVEEIENGLIPFGHYGKRRATVCAALILDMLKKAEVRGHIQEGREKTSRLKGTT